MTEDINSVDEIRDIRRAARQIARSRRPIHERLQALVHLLEKATHTGDVAADAVRVEAQALIRGKTTPPTLGSTDPVEAAIRRQLSQGRVRCVACLRSLPTEEQPGHGAPSPDRRSGAATSF